MKTTALIGTALGNAVRSKMRTFLTVLAIFIGAFALTLTSGLGAGINKYVENVVAGFGQPNQLYVSPAQSFDMGMGVGGSSEPQEYDPEARQGAAGAFGGQNLTKEDLETLRGLDHVTDVQPVEFVRAQYVEDAAGTQWALPSMGGAFEVDGLQLVAGEKPSADANEVTMPENWVSALGGSAPADIVGQELTFVIENLAQQEEQVTAVIAGVSEPAVSGTGGNPVPSAALSAAMAEAMNSGLPESPETTYVQAVVTVEDLAANETSVKQAIADNDMQGMSLEDQLGALQGILNVVIWVFNGFGLIALLAASFGIVNTLLMSVQERTREIGLMKALGMTSGKVFGLFSLEALVIGFMGSALGIGLGVATGLILQQVLLSGPFSEVTGLVLFAINPLGLLGILGLILLIAFLAGTLPAARAARKDPIASLRYE
ncbi:MAG: ABC transporter permease [Micrococcus sp.]|nr:ABC transporter permease [Micrococcus sp.]